MTRVYIMSIKPKYAKAVLEGRKVYELRRLQGSKPLEEDSLVIVYASGNLQSIIGEFRVGKVIVGSPEKIWELVGRSEYGLDDEARRYIEGARRAMAIQVREPKIYNVKIELSKIRRIIPGWNPPYSYAELEEGDPLYELIVKRARITSSRRD
mgnify:CR=1 FL=1